MKKDKLNEETLRLLVFVIGIFSICILLLTFKLKVNAASDDQFSFPYVVPEWRNNTSAISDSLISSADSVIRTRFNLSEDDNIMFFVTDLQSNLGTYQWNTLNFIVNPSVLTQVDENFSFLDNNVTLSCSFSGTYEFKWDNSYRNIGQSYGNVSILGNSSVIEISQGVYTPRYPFYLSGSDVFYGDFLVFTNEVSSVISPDVFETGHAQEPSFDSDSIIDSSLHPNIKPTFPTFNTYNITNYITPSIDTSTVETLLESLIDVVVYNVSYVVSNIVGVIQNLWNNLGNFLEYIGDLLSYLLNRVINTIKQTADNLYQNFKELFEPVLNSFANFINMVNTLYGLGLKDGVFDIPTLFGSLFLPNESDLDLLVSTYFNEFEVFELTTTSVSSLFYNIFDLLNDDPVYSFHMPSFTFHGISFPSYEISFDWYLPYKATGDLFISAFLIVGYLYWLWVRLSGIFHGVSPDPVPISSGEHQITGDFWTPKSF